ncbi:hypothetical protein CPB84DRAFT_1789822 [Gymnopilus junonius]|uniref:DUF6534 domain-containing protein n=1 Tax=Gymnopilus junonius TaxID=109634 RepID=A0A9P5NFN6_GYMJU|nr:hypothetical protein CPB84DRAFT_1789822 [Gymnopilus junonius]
MDRAVPAEYLRANLIVLIISHGPMFVGLAINICLLGIMTTQTYLYYAKYSSDKKWIKAFVALLYALNGIITASVQIFFALRILSLTKTMLCFILITVPAATAAVSAFVTTFVVSRQPLFFQACGKVPDIIWLGSGVAAGVVISFLLVHFFRKLGMKRSDIVVDRIIRFTIQTGLFTVVVAILDIIFFLTNKSGMYVKSKGKITAPLYPVKDTYY